MSSTSIDLDPSRYSTHSMCMGIAAMVAIDGFNEIQVKCMEDGHLKLIHYTWEIFKQNKSFTQKK